MTEETPTTQQQENFSSGSVALIASPTASPRRTRSIGALYKHRSKSTTSGIEQLEVFKEQSKHSFEDIKWILLFFDLIYVVVIQKISNILLECVLGDKMSRGLAYLVGVAYFVLMFYTRLQLDYYSCSYMACTFAGTEITKTYPLFQSDIFHRIFTGIYGLTAFLMAMSLTFTVTEGEDGEFGICNFINIDRKVFVGAFMFSRFTIFLFYFCLWYFATEEGFQARSSSIIIFRMLQQIASILAMITGSVNIKYFTGTLIGVALLEVIMDTGLIHSVQWKVEIQPKSFRSSEVSMHSDRFDRALQDKENPLFCDASLLLERLGILVLLSTGESVLQFGQGEPEFGSDYGFGVVVSSYVIIFSAAMQFFETIGQPIIEITRTHPIIKFSSLYIFLYIPMTIAILLLTTSVLFFYQQPAVDAASTSSTSNPFANHTFHFTFSPSLAPTLAPTAAPEISLDSNKVRLAISCAFCGLLGTLMEFLHRLAKYAPDDLHYTFTNFYRLSKQFTRREKLGILASLGMSIFYLVLLGMLFEVSYMGYIAIFAVYSLLINVLLVYAKLARLVISSSDENEEANFPVDKEKGGSICSSPGISVELGNLTRNIPSSSGPKERNNERDQTNSLSSPRGIETAAEPEAVEVINPIK